MKLIIPIFVYILIRWSSYMMFDPRPYLWWHAALDVAAIVFLVCILRILDRKVWRRQ